MPISKVERRGGKREGAGRKANPAKALHMGSKTALRFLKSIDHEARLRKIVLECGDPRIEAQIILKAWEFAYGKPEKPSDESKIGFDPHAPLRVIIEHIGRGFTHPLAAETK